LAERVTMRWAAIRHQPADLLAIKSACEMFSVAARERDVDRMGEANRAFHLAIGNASHNPLVASFHESLQNSSLRLSRLAFAEASVSDAEYRTYYSEVDEQHQQMLRGIEQRDPELGDEIAKRHAALFRDRIARFLRDSLAADVPLAEAVSVAPAVNPRRTRS